MKVQAFLATLSLSLLLAPAVTSGALSSWYSDVPDYSSSYDGIFYLTQSNVVTGYEDGTFHPNDPVSRVEALKMILLDTEVPLSWEETAAFPDIEEDAWYMDYVNTAVSKGIMNGDPEGTFRPTDPVNRAEALKMLILASDKVSDLPDIASDYWYSAYLGYGQEHALITPDSTGDYLPSESLTRGELADLLYRFEKEPYTGQVEYGIGSYYGYSFDGHNTASGTALDAYGFMCAHKTLPFGTVLRVTNLANDTYVDVEVVDRGPYTAGYIVDLTPAAFEQIGALSTGILNVRVEVLK
jgi:hypothetical protein